MKCVAAWVQRYDFIVSAACREEQSVIFCFLFSLVDGMSGYCLDILFPLGVLDSSHTQRERL